MPVVLRAAVSGADREACCAVRMTVFVEEQGVPPWEEVDADDETASHFLAEQDGRVVATARLVEKGGGAAKIGRVAVLREHRRRGIGHDLMRHVMAAVPDHIGTLVLDAQLPVIPFYERLGFMAEGPVFMDAGIPHRRMSRPR